MAYWSFDANTNEGKSNTAVTSSANASIIDGGIKGKALNLNTGYLYYANQFSAFKTHVIQKLDKNCVWFLQGVFGGDYFLFLVRWVEQQSGDYYRAQLLDSANVLKSG